MHFRDRLNNLYTVLSVILEIAWFSLEWNFKMKQKFHVYFCSKELATTAAETGQLIQSICSLSVWLLQKFLVDYVLKIKGEKIYDLDKNAKAWCSVNAQKIIKRFGKSSSNSWLMHSWSTYAVATHASPWPWCGI